MAQSDPALGGLGNKTTQQLSFEERIKVELPAVRDLGQQTLLAFCQIRKQNFQRFWQNPQRIGPNVFVARHGLPWAKAMFLHDFEIATMLKDKLTLTGLPEATINELVPGVPEEWIVNFQAETVDEFIKART